MLPSKKTSRKSEEEITLAQFSNLQGNLAQKNQLIEMLQNKLADLEAKLKPQNPGILELLAPESTTLPCYDDLYSAFLTASEEKKDLEEQLNNIKDGAIEVLMEKETQINQLKERLEDQSQRFRDVEIAQIELSKERDSIAQKLSEMQETIEKKKVETEEKLKNIEIEIDKEAEKRFQEHLKRNKVIEDQMQEELRKSDEKLMQLEQRFEEMEKKYRLNEEFYRRQVNTLSRELEETQSRRVFDAKEIEEIENKYKSMVRNLEKEIKEAQNQKEIEIRLIEIEKIQLKKDAEIRECDNKKIAEIKQSLKVYIEELKKEIAGKDALIEEMHKEYQEKFQELKEKYELEKIALEIQNKKLKQEEEEFVRRRRSDLVLKTPPLLNELVGFTFDEKSPMFETFKNTSIDFEHGTPSELEVEEESDALRKEIERLTHNSQQNLIKTQESMKVLRRNSMLELENLINIYKSDMTALKEEIGELKVKLEDKSLENERKDAQLVENVKKLEEAEGKNKDIEGKLQEVQEKCIGAGQSLQKLERILASNTEVEPGFRNGMFEEINLCRTRFVDIESHVSDASIRQLEVQDIVTQVRYQCSSVPASAGSVRDEILALRSENESLKELNAVHEVDKEALLKEIQSEEKALSNLKDAIQVMSQTYSNAFDDKIIDNKEFAEGSYKLRDCKENLKDSLDSVGKLKRKLKEIQSLETENGSFKERIFGIRKENERLKFENAFFQRINAEATSKIESSLETADKLLEFQEKMQENLFRNEAAAKQVEGRLEQIEDPQFKDLLEAQLTIVKTTFVDLESNIEGSAAHLIQIRDKLNEVTYSLKTRALKSPENEVLEQINHLKQRNTILKRKQTFLSIKDIETEKMINEIEDQIEKRNLKRMSRQKDSVCSIRKITFARSDSQSSIPKGLITEPGEIKPCIVSEEPEDGDLLLEADEKKETDGCDELNLNQRLDLVKDKIISNRIDEEKFSEDDNENRKISIEVKNLKTEYQELSSRIAFHNLLFRKILENIHKSHENLSNSLQSTEETAGIINRLDNETVSMDSVNKVKRNLMEKTESLLRNVEKSEKGLLASFELETEILNLLRAEAERTDNQEYLAKIAEYEQENAELRAKLEDLEQRKEVAIDLLKSEKIGEKAIEVLEKGEPGVMIEDMKLEITELNGKNDRLKRMNSVLGLQISLGQNMVRDLRGRESMVQTLELDEALQKIQQQLDPIQDVQTYESKKLTEIKGKYSEILAALKSGLPILLSPVEPLPRKFEVLTELNSKLQRLESERLRSEASDSEPPINVEENPYALLQSGLSLVNKNLAEIKVLLTEESLEENDEVVKEKITADCLLNAENQLNLAKIKSVFSHFYAVLQEANGSLKDFQDMDPGIAGPAARLEELERDLLFNQGKIAEMERVKEAGELETMKSAVQAAVLQLTDPNSSTKIKNSAIEKLRGLIPWEDPPQTNTSESVRKAEDTSDFSKKSIKKKLKEKNRSLSILELQPVTFQSHQELEAERMQVFSSPSREKSRLSQKKKLEDKLELERSLESAVKQGESIVKEVESAQLQMETLNKDLRRNLAILMSDESSELEKQQALKRLLKDVEKSEDIQKTMKFLATEQKDLTRNIQGFEKEIAALKAGLRTLQKKLKIETLLRKETRIKLKISQKLLEESEEKIRELQDQLSAKLRELEQFLARFDSQEMDMQSYREGLEGLSGTLQELEGKCAESKDKLMAANEKISQTRGELKEKEENLDRLHTELKLQGKNLEETSDLLKIREEDLKRLRSDFGRIEGLLSDKERGDFERILALQELEVSARNLRELEGELASSKTKLEAQRQAERLVEQLQREVVELKAGRERLEKEKSEVSKAKIGLEETVLSLKTEKEGLVKEKAGLEGRNTEILKGKAVIEELKCSLELENEKIRRENEELESKRQLIDKAKSKAEAQTAILVAEKAELAATLERTIESLTAQARSQLLDSERSMSQKHALALQEAKRVYETQLYELERLKNGEIQALEGELEEVKRVSLEDINEKSARISNLKKSLEAVEMKVALKNSEIEGLRSEVERLESEGKEKTESMEGLRRSQRRGEESLRRKNEELERKVVELAEKGEEREERLREEVQALESGFRGEVAKLTTEHNLKQKELKATMEKDRVLFEEEKSVLLQSLEGLASEKTRNEDLIQRLRREQESQKRAVSETMEKRDLRIAELETENSEFHREIEEKRAEIADAKKERIKDSAVISRLRTEVGELEQKVSSKEKDFEEREKDLIERVKAIEEQKRETSGLLERARLENRGLSEKVQSVTSLLGEKDCEVASLRSELSTLESQLKTLQTSYKSLEASMKQKGNELGNELEQVRTAYDELEKAGSKRLEDLNEKLRETMAKMRDRDGVIERLEREIAEKAGILEERGSEIESLKERALRLREELCKESSKEKARFEEELKRKDCDLSSLENLHSNEVRALKGVIEELGEKVRGKEAEILRIVKEREKECEVRVETERREGERRIEEKDHEIMAKTEELRRKEDERKKLLNERQGLVRKCEETAQEAEETALSLRQELEKQRVSAADRENRLRLSLKQAEGSLQTVQKLLDQEKEARMVSESELKKEAESKLRETEATLQRVRSELQIRTANHENRAKAAESQCLELESKLGSAFSDSEAKSVKIEELLKAQTRLASENRSLSLEKTQLSRDLEQKSIEKGEVEQEAQRKQLEIESLRKSLGLIREDLQKERKDLQSQILGLKDLLASAEESLLSQRKEAETSEKRFEENLRTARSEARRLEGQTLELKSAFSRELERKSEQIEEIQGDLARKGQELESLKTQISRQKGEFSQKVLELTNEAQSRELDIRRNEEKARVWQEKAEKSGAEVKNLEGQLKEEKERVYRELATRNREMEEIKAKFERKEAENRESRAECEGLRSEIEEKQRLWKGELANSETNHGLTVKSLEGRISELEARLSDLRVDSEEKSRRIDELNRALSRLNGEKIAMEESLSRDNSEISQENERKSREISDLIEEKRVKASEIENLKASIKRLNEDHQIELKRFEEIREKKLNETRDIVREIEENQRKVASDYKEKWHVMEESNRKLRVEIQRLESVNVAEKEEKQREVSLKMAEISDLKGKLCQVRQDIELLKSKSLLREGDHEREVKRMAERVKEREKLIGELEQDRKELETVRKLLTQKEFEVKSVSEELSHYKTELLATFRLREQDFQARESLFLQEKSAILSETETIAGQLRAMDSEKRQLLDQIQKLSSANADWEEGKASLGGELASSREKIRVLERRIEENEETIRGLQVKESDAQLRLKEMREKSQFDLVKIEISLKELISKYSELSEKYMKNEELYKKELENRDLSIKSLSAKKSQLENELLSAYGTLRSLEMLLRSKSYEIEELLARIAGFKATQTTDKKSLLVIEEKLREIKKSLEDCEARLMEKDSAFRSLEEDKNRKTKQKLAQILLRKNAYKKRLGQLAKIVVEAFETSNQTLKDLKELQTFYESSQARKEVSRIETLPRNLSRPGEDPYQTPRKVEPRSLQEIDKKINGYFEKLQGLEMKFNELQGTVETSPGIRGESNSHGRKDEISELAFPMVEKPFPGDKPSSISTHQKRDQSEIFKKTAEKQANPGFSGSSMGLWRQMEEKNHENLALQASLKKETGEFQRMKQDYQRLIGDYEKAEENLRESLEKLREANRESKEQRTFFENARDFYGLLAVKLGAGHEILKKADFQEEFYSVVLKTVSEIAANKPPSIITEIVPQNTESNNNNVSVIEKEDLSLSFIRTHRGYESIKLDNDLNLHRLTKSLESCKLENQSLQSKLQAQDAKLRELLVFNDLLQEDLKSLFLENDRLKSLFESGMRTYREEVDKYRVSLDNIKELKEKQLKQVRLSQEKEKENMKEEYKRLLQEKAHSFLEEKKSLEFERDRLKANLLNIENSISFEFQKMRKRPAIREFSEESPDRVQTSTRASMKEKPEIVERLKRELVKTEEKMQQNKISFIEERGKLNQEMKRLKDEVIGLKIRNGKLELEIEYYRVKHREIVKELKKSGDKL